MTTTTTITYHEREDDGRLGCLDEPKKDKAGELDQGEEMDPPELDMAEVHVVRLMFGWDQVQEDAVHELNKNNYNSKVTNHQQQFALPLRVQGSMLYTVYILYIPSRN